MSILLKWTLTLAVTWCSLGMDERWQAAGFLEPMAFKHRVMLDPAYTMLWTPNEQNIVFEVQVATAGFVGLGFSPSGSMKGADIVLGWVDNENRPYVQDLHALDNARPLLDETQDVRLLGGYQNRTHTVIRFWRPWDTCDLKHDRVLNDDTTRVIWAYGLDDTFKYHQNRRGVKSIFLKDPGFKIPNFGPDVRAWDIRAPRVTLPSNVDTLYWCWIVKIPPIQRKNHLIGFVPLIEERNRPYVHHILLYECLMPNTARNMEKWLNVDGFQCYTPNMPPSWSHCAHTVLGYAIGAEGMMLPDHIGFPMGQEHGGATYYLMEVHYDNPQLTPGIVDSSGLRIFYTENLRQYDAGMIAAGHTVSPLQIIPPQKRKWTTVGTCPAECTRKMLPAHGIKVFQVLLHTHVAGRSVVVKHIRNGKQLPTVMQDLNYDFNYQQIRSLRNELHVLPGDSFLVECGYDTTSRSQTTFGGFRTNDEMCIAFLVYYPRGSLSQCSSYPALNQVYNSMGIHRIAREEVIKKRIREFRGKEIDERREILQLQNILQGKETSRTNLPLYYSDLLKAVVAVAPRNMQNVTLYNRLSNNNIWRDNQISKELETQFNYGDHVSVCQSSTEYLGNQEQIPIQFHGYLSQPQKRRQCFGRK